MSKALAPWARRGGALHLSIGVGEAPGFDVCGLRFDDRGRILAVSNGSLDHFHAGLPFNLHGRLIVSEAPVDHTDQNVTHSAASSSAVCIGPGPVAYWSEGLPYNSSGQIVYTESAPPPVIPFPEFTHDFTTASLGAFDHTRASDATGADHEGIIRTVGDDVPVFPGARFADVLVGGSWNPLTGNATVTPTGDNEYAVTFPESGSAIVRVLSSVGLLVGRAFRFSATVWAEGADIGKKIEIIFSRSTGGDYKEYALPITLSGTPTRVTAQLGDAWNADNTHINLQFRVSLIDPGEKASSMRFADDMFEEVTGAVNDAPSEYSAEPRWYATTNGNTVDPVTGIVTEAPGVPLTTIEGLQLEGARTNDALYANDWSNAAWVKTNITPSGAQLTASAANATILQVAGTVTATASFDIRRVSGAGAVEITADNGATWTAVAITGTSQRFSVTAAAGTAAAGIRIVTSGDVIEASWAGVEAGAFASSRIETEGVPETRAATACTAPFAAIPQLPDAGLVNDICGHVIVELYHDFDAVSSFERLISINNGTGENRLDIQKGSTGQLGISVRRASSTTTTYVSGLPNYPAGTTIDVRFKLSEAGGAQIMVNGSEWGVDGANNADIPSPVDIITLMTTATGGGNEFGIIKHVRIVPQALSDAEIESW